MAASRSRRMGSDVNLTAPAPGPVARQRMLPPPNAVTLTWISPPWCWQSRCTVTWRVPAANRTRAVGTVMEASWPYCSNTRVECGSRGNAEANRCGFFTSAHELAHTAITASTEATEHTCDSLTLPPSRALRPRGAYDAQPTDQRETRKVARVLVVVPAVALSVRCNGLASVSCPNFRTSA